MTLTSLRGYAPLLAVLLAACTPDAAAQTGGSSGRSSSARDAAAATANTGSANPAGASASAPSPPASPADEAMPATSGDELQGRGRHLLEALAQGNPHLASDLLFPRDGFAATRDTADPTRAWEKTVSAPFARAVLQLHRRVRGLDRAQLVALELGPTAVQLSPRKKEWKKPVWRVRHARLVVSIDGRTHRIEIPELTSWRGAWYVTKLR